MSPLLILIATLSVILIILIMLQSKGTGLSIIPGQDDFGKFERRGAEKTIHTITITLVVAFIASTIAYFFFN